MATLETTVYRSDDRRAPLVTEFRHLWQHRGLVRLLVGRDLTVRYKRSLLGVWWTLLNPLLTSMVLWVVFSQVFRVQTPGGAPFIVYLLSGILTVTFFSQGILLVATSLLGNAGVLAKVYVPAEVFAFSTAVATTVNFCIGLVPLFIIQLALGVGIPWTAPLVLVPTLCMLALVAGLGLLLATLAIEFPDVLDLTQVVVQLISFLTPTFYPVSILDEGVQKFLFLNPVYPFVEVVRGTMYGSTETHASHWFAMFAWSAGMLVLGGWSFGRRWRRLAVML